MKILYSIILSLLLVLFFLLPAIAIAQEPDVGIESICGNSDDRVASTDPRVGRVFYNNGSHNCTVWLTSVGALLTAGHCTDFDPDDSGPSLPDGILDLTGQIEFNVPASQSNGAPVTAASTNLYRIIPGTVSWNYDGDGQGFGKDWAIFGVSPNPITGLTPYQAQGSFFRLTRETPIVSATVRVTGFGVDGPAPNFGANGGPRNADSQTNQTHTGSYAGEFNSGANFWHTYQVDTQGANSGSPIIWDFFDFAIGIHTNAGCSDPVGSTTNRGTSFNHAPLENALQNFYGVGTVFVDKDFPNAMLPNGVTTRNGAVFRPFTTVADGVNTVIAGNTVSIVAGSYNEPMIINKAMTLMAPVGAVTIGQ